MENLEFESINNFRIASSVDTVVGNIDSYRSSTLEDDYRMQSTITNFMWMGTILLSFIIWIICVISLILNCVKRNVGKAIFSGIGIAIPLISCFISGIGKTFVEIEDNLVGVGVFLCILAIILELVFGIISFIFCFSKDKRNK